MKAYEGLFVFSPALSPDQLKQQHKKLEDLLKKFKGKVTEKTDYGKKPLGYLIQKFQEGNFWLFDFEMPTETISDMRKALELNEDILKYMVTCKDPKIEKRIPAPLQPVPAEAPQASK